MRDATHEENESINKYIESISDEIVPVANGGETAMTDGITECCGYDFGTEAFREKIRVKFCPVCGKRITKIYLDD